MKLCRQTDDARRHFTSSRPRTTTDEIKDKTLILLSNRNPYKNAFELNTEMPKN
jgi:hypothetical protein